MNVAQRARFLLKMVSVGGASLMQVVERNADC